MTVRSIYPIYREDEYVSNNSFKSFQKLAPQDLNYVDDPKAADLQVVFETYHNELTWSLGRKKVCDANLVAYAEADKFNFPIVPGLYVSLTQQYALSGRSESHAYLSYLAETDGNPTCKGYVESEKRHRCSFMGKKKGSPRIELFDALESLDGYFIVDTTQSYDHFGGRRDLSKQEPYAQAIREAEFCLCPRGSGASSIRLFEAMRLGTAPIIVGDAWVAPKGPDWDRFSVRFKEKDILHIPKWIKEHSHRHREMGRLARKTWETYFAPSTLVPDILRQLQLCSQHTRGERGLRRRRYIHHTLLHSLRHLKLRLIGMR